MSTLVATLPFLVAGAALGFFHFTALGWNVTLLVTDGRRWISVVVLVARLAVTVATFVIIARYGALPLLFAAAGFAGVRPFIVRRAKATP